MSDDPIRVGDGIEITWLWFWNLGSAVVVAVNAHGVVLDRAVQSPLMRLFRRPPSFMIPWRVISLR